MSKFTQLAKLLKKGESVQAPKSAAVPEPRKQFLGTQLSNNERRQAFERLRAGLYTGTSHDPGVDSYAFRRMPEAVQEGVLLPYATTAVNKLPYEAKLNKGTSNSARNYATRNAKTGDLTSISSDVTINPNEPVNGLFHETGHTLNTLLSGLMDPNMFETMGTKYSRPFSLKWWTEQKNLDDKLKDAIIYEPYVSGSNGYIGSWSEFEPSDILSPDWKRILATSSDRGAEYLERPVQLGTHAMNRNSKIGDRFNLDKWNNFGNELGDDFELFSDKAAIQSGALVNRAAEKLAKLKNISVDEAIRRLTEYTDNYADPSVILDLDFMHGKDYYKASDKPFHMLSNEAMAKAMEYMPSNLVDQPELKSLTEAIENTDIRNLDLNWSLLGL